MNRKCDRAFTHFIRASICSIIQFQQLYWACGTMNSRINIHIHAEFKLNEWHYVPFISITSSKEALQLILNLPGDMTHKTVKKNHQSTV